MSKEIIIKEIEKIEKTINKKFDEYLNLIALSIKNLFNHFFQPNQKEEVPKNNAINSKLQIIKTIQHSHKINSLCFLKDGRLVLGSDGRISIYNTYTFESFTLSYYTEDTYSVCGLKNGNLASAGSDRKIRIWEINGNNYKQIHTLEGHNYRINKVIELKDGKLCSCSDDKATKIWDNKTDYECIQTLKQRSAWVISVIEISDYILSASYDNGENGDNSVIIWNKHTFECIKVVKGIYCLWNNGLGKLKENEIVIGGRNEIFVLDTLSFQYKSFKNSRLGEILSIYVLREGLVLLGNNKGRVFCFDLLYNQIVFKQKLNLYDVLCIVKSENDEKFILSEGKMISIFTLNFS